MTTMCVLMGLVAGLAVTAGLLRSWEARQARRLLARWKAELTQSLASDAWSRSQRVLRGLIAEQVAPLQEGFPWAPEDVRYLGRPIDYVIFDGLGAARRCTRDDLREIVIVDVKTGRAGLNRSERRIRDCVEAGRVAWADGGVSR